MEKEKRRSSKSGKTGKSSSSKSGSGKSSSKSSSSRREGNSDAASAPSPAPAPPLGGRPPYLRGTHNRPWQREASNTRGNIATDDEYYNFASMDVVMAPVAPVSPVPSPTSVPPLAPAAVAPARSIAARILSSNALSPWSASPEAVFRVNFKFQIYFSSKSRISAQNRNRICPSGVICLASRHKRKSQVANIIFQI